MTVLSPTSGFTFTTLMPTFSWEAFPDAVDYHVSVWNLFDGLWVRQGSVGNVTEYTIESELTDTDYRFSVYAVSAVNTINHPDGIQFARRTGISFTVEP